MKNILLMMVGLLLASATFAQSTGASTSTVTPEQTQMKELCNDIRVYNNKRAEAKIDMVKGNFAASKTELASAADCKREIDARAALLKTEGVAHPIRSAHKEIKRSDVKIIAADVKVVEADKIAEKAAVKSGDATAAISLKTTIKADKDLLRKDIKTARRDAGWHIPFVRNNHVSHA